MHRSPHNVQEFRSSTGSTSSKESKDTSVPVTVSELQVSLHVSMCYIGTKSHVIPLQLTAVHTRDL